MSGLCSASVWQLLLVFCNVLVYISRPVLIKMSPAREFTRLRTSSVLCGYNAWGWLKSRTTTNRVAASCWGKLEMITSHWASDCHWSTLNLFVVWNEIINCIISSYSQNIQKLDCKNFFFPQYFRFSYFLFFFSHSSVFCLNQKHSYY